jgi:hypothetical protein
LVPTALIFRIEMTRAGGRSGFYIGNDREVSYRLNGEKEPLVSSKEAIFFPIQFGMKFPPFSI